MSTFVYLYRRPAQAALSPQEMQERMQRWRIWFEALEKSGHLAELGQPLVNDAGAVVRDASGRTTDGPYAETKDLVIGYSIIEAESLEQALSLTANWPGFGEGGMIEVRPIAKM